MPAYEREDGFLDSGMSFGDCEFVKEAEDDFTKEEKDFYIKVNDLIQWIEDSLRKGFIFGPIFQQSIKHFIELVDRSFNQLKICSPRSLRGNYDCR